MEENNYIPFDISSYQFSPEYIGLDDVDYSLSGPGSYAASINNIIGFLKSHPAYLYSTFFNSIRDGGLNSLRLYNDPSISDEARKELELYLLSFKTPLIDDVLSPLIILELFKDPDFISDFFEDDLYGVKKLTFNKLYNRFLQYGDVRYFTDDSSKYPYWLYPEEQVDNRFETGYVSPEERNRRRLAFEYQEEGNVPYVIEKDDNDAYVIRPITGDLSYPYLGQYNYGLQWEPYYTAYKTPIREHDYVPWSKDLKWYENIRNNIVGDMVNPDVPWYEKGWHSLWRNLLDYFSPNSAMPTLRQLDEANEHRSNAINAGVMGTALLASRYVPFDKIPYLRLVWPYLSGAINGYFALEGSYDLLNNWNDLSTSEKLWDAWMATGLKNPLMAGLNRIKPGTALLPNLLKERYLFNPILNSNLILTRLPFLYNYAQVGKERNLYNGLGKFALYNNPAARFENWGNLGYYVPKSNIGKALANEVLLFNHKFFMPTPLVAAKATKEAYDLFNNKRSSVSYNNKASSVPILRLEAPSDNTFIEGPEGIAPIGWAENYNKAASISNK